MLAVHIEAIAVAEQGVVAIYPGWGPLGDQVQASIARILPIQDGKALFSDRVALPIRPMIGVIGTAPTGEAVPNGTPGPHGGNLDTVDVAEGATAFLPVFVPGGLLGIGDVHAVMGDGEVCGTAVECRAEVSLKIELRRGLQWQIPHILRSGEHFVLASGKTLDEAVRIATQETVLYLAAALKIPWEEAYMLMSLACDLRVSQVVNPLRTVRVRIPKFIFA